MSYIITDASILNSILSAYKNQNWTLAYQAVFNALTDATGNPKAGVEEAVWVWVNGAKHVNANDNPFATYIRNYTATQYELRTGLPDNAANKAMINDFIQLASNQIARNFIADLLDIDPGVTPSTITALGIDKGKLPSISDVGKYDAAGAASFVFRGDASSTTDANASPWAGTALFVNLGENRFFKDWVLNLDTIKNDTVSGGKQEPGAYDLISVAQATLINKTIAAGFTLWWDSLFDEYDIGNRVQRIGATAVAETTTLTQTFFENTYGSDVGAIKIGQSIFNDTVAATENDESYQIGTVGNDTALNVAYNNRVVHAGAGNDTINENSAASSGGTQGGIRVIDGGDGTDKLDYTQVTNTTVSIAADTKSAFGGRLIITKGNGYKDYVYNTEKITATPQDDKLIYSDAFQNAKVTLVDAGAGKDTIDFSKSTKGVSYTLNGKIGSVQTANFENATGTQYSDAIIGNTSNNTLIGNGGNDVLQGNGGTDLLYGGSGKDLFSLGNNTFVKDATPDDYASWGGIQLTGGVSQWWNEGGFAYWTPFSSILASSSTGLMDFTSLAMIRLDVMPMTTVRYALSDSDQLVVQVARGRVGQAVIDNYDLDLNTGKASGHITAFQQVMEKSSIADYTNYINLALQAAFGICITGTDPLVIDLNKNGLELTDAGRGVYFDFDNNGFAERTAWVKAGDGILVRDLNANGKIDNVTEMFGNATTPGLTALKALDGNKDNKITSADTGFTSLKVWQDLDKDGITDSGELKTLAQVNIAQISLVSETPAVAVTHGNMITAQSTVTFSDGSTTKMGDVRLSGNLADTKYLGNGTVSPAAAALPDLRGFGTLTNLDVAMTNDAALLSKVNATTTLPLTTTWAQYETKAADILFRWAKVDTVTPTAMGASFDRQKLAFLEKYFGYQLAPRDASGNPTLASVEELADSWRMH